MLIFKFLAKNKCVEFFYGAKFYENQGKLNIFLHDHRPSGMN